MEYSKKRRVALFCAISAALTLSVQSNSSWRRILKPKFVKTASKILKETLFVQRILPKLGATPTIMEKKYGRLDSRNKFIKNMDPEELAQELKEIGRMDKQEPTNSKQVIKFDKSDNRAQHIKNHKDLSTDLYFIKRGAYSLAGVPVEEIDFFRLLGLLSLGPKKEMEQLTNFLIEEGKLDTQIGIGDCAGLPGIFEQLRAHFKNER